MSELESDAGDISLLSSTTFRPPRHFEAVSPTPQRLLSKSLWSSSTAPLNNKSHGVDANEPSTPPLAGPSHRPSSTAPSSSFNQESNSTPRPTPRMANRRTSSSNSITRSRSLNIKSPPIDFDSTTTPTRTPSMRLGWSRRPGEPRPPPLIKDDVGRKMRRWVKEIVVCNFDLERGPVVERRAVGRRWGQGEKENV